MKKKIKVDYAKPEWLFAPYQEYYDYDGVKRSLTLLFPFNRKWLEGKPDEKYPLIVYVPGAAWHRQEMYNDTPKFAKVAERGAVFAAVQVRESDIATFPAQIYDIHHAVSYLIDIAEQFHIDTNRIYLAGNSSGGHLALITAFTKAQGLHIPEDAKTYEIKGVIGISASSEIDVCLRDPLPLFFEKRPTACLLGVETEEECFAVASKASCTTYVSSDVKLPPVLLFHHDGDPIVNVECSRVLSEKLEACGQSVDYYELEGIGHCDNGMWEKDVIDITMKFIEEH